ncbi:MAG: hypothetical protein CL886_07265 [Dehalococcoidia bacterium]|nr:hypothetical protein [Dehalococcoidia bacterium]
MDPDKLKILFVTPYFRPYIGGIERAIEQLSYSLFETKTVSQISVLTTKYSFPRIPHPEWPDLETTSHNISIFRLKGYPRRSLPIYSCPLVWFSPLQIKTYLELFEPDIIHFVGDGWFWGNLWTWFYFRKRARFIFTPSYHPLPSRKSWLKIINTILSRLVDKVIPLTNTERDYLRSDYHVPLSKQHVIGWGASSLSQSIRKPDDDQLKIISVGRLGKHKGQKWLLEIYLKAMPEFNQPTHLILVGGDEGERDILQNFVVKNNISDQVTFTGELEDNQLSEVYSSGDIFALFSQYEAFGLVFLEAMLKKLPVLTHDVGSIKDILKAGAIISPAYDEPSVVTSLINLVNDKEYRVALGEEGYNYARANFSWASVASQYLSIYRP